MPSEANIQWGEFYPLLGQFGGPGQPWPVKTLPSSTDSTGHIGTELMLTATAFLGGIPIPMGNYGPIGTELLGSQEEWFKVGRFQDTPPIAQSFGRMTDADDTPPSTYIPGGLRPFNYGSSLFDGLDPLSRRGTSDGVLTITDPGNKELDWLRNYSWDAAKLTLYRGKATEKRKNWTAVGKFRSSGLQYDNGQWQLHFQDLSWQLQGLVHNEYYSGLGGLDGDINTVGIWKPYVVGRVKNIEAQTIDVANSVYQVSVSSCSQITVKHGGVTLTNDGDYASLEDLLAASITSGRYATCLRFGLFRLNITINFGIRADVVGDNDTLFGHGQPLTRAQIARRIATGRGVSKLDDLKEIDGPSFSKMDSYHPALCGWYFKEATTKLDALNKVMAGILGWWRVKPNGRLSVGWTELRLDQVTQTFTFGKGGMGNPQMTEWAAPRAGTVIPYQWNYGPQERNDLAGSVSDTEALILKNQAGFTQDVSRATAKAYPTSVLVTVPEAGFWNADDAAQEATRQQSIMGKLRRRFTTSLPIDPFADFLGQTCVVAGTDKMGFGDNIPFLIVGLSSSGTNITRVELYG